MGKTVIPCSKLRECMLFFREVSHWAGDSFLSFHLWWFGSQFTISFFVVFFLFCCFGLFFVLGVGCGWLRVVMQNQLQVCLKSCVVHGVTCEVHELAFWENLGFSMGCVL